MGHHHLYHYKHNRDPRRREKKGAERTFEEILTENKIYSSSILRTWTNYRGMNVKTTTLRHIIIQLLKDKDYSKSHDRLVIGKQSSMQQISHQKPWRTERNEMILLKS